MAKPIKANEYFYSKIVLSRLSPAAVAILKKIKKDTNKFKDVDAQNEAAFIKLATKIRAEKPEAWKDTKENLAANAAKRPVPAPKPEPEPEPKPEPPKRKPVKRVTLTNKEKDAARLGKRPGWRIPGSNRVPLRKDISSGLAYFENRSNRADVNRKGYPYLNKGGKTKGTGVGKVFYQQHGIGSSKYTISYHDGEQTHKDGSPFYGIKIFNNKKDLESAISKFKAEGYTETSGFGYAKGGKLADEKLANLAYQIHAADQGWKKNHPEEFKKMVEEYQKEFSKMHGGKRDQSQFARGGKVISVTKISDIPDIKQKVRAGKVSYRGLGFGKLYNDFRKLAGESGTRIKVDGKEYYITDTDYEKLREYNGGNHLRFDAPYRKYAKGGQTDLNSIIADIDLQLEKLVKDDYWESDEYHNKQDEIYQKIGAIKPWTDQDDDYMLKATAEEILEYMKERAQGLNSKAKITEKDITVGSIFRMDNGIEWEIDEIEDDPKFGKLVSTSITGGKKGDYRDPIDDLVDFLNENNSIKVSNAGEKFAMGGRIKEKTHRTI